MVRRRRISSHFVLVIPTTTCRQLIFSVFIIVLFISAGVLFKHSDYVALMPPSSSIDAFDNVPKSAHFSSSRFYRRRKMLLTSTPSVIPTEFNEFPLSSPNLDWDEANHTTKLISDIHSSLRITAVQLRRDYSELNTILLHQPANSTAFREALRKSGFGTLLKNAGFPLLDSLVDGTMHDNISDIFRPKPNECLPLSQNVSTFSHPKLAHFVRFFKRPNKIHIDFLQFTSMISVANLYQAQRVILHSNYEPVDDVYYNILRHALPCQLRWHHVEPRRYIANHRVWFVEHESDLAKLELLHEYGGIALDFDVIAVNASRLADKQHEHDCVISADDNNHLNIGFISCRPKSPYVRAWIAGYENDYKSWGWVYNSAVKPYAMLTMRVAQQAANSTEKLDDESGEFLFSSPDAGSSAPENSIRSIFIEQMMAFPGYNTRGLWMTPHGVPEWRRYTAVHHMLKTYLLSTQVELDADSDVLFIRAAIGEIIRNVYSLAI